MLLNGVPDAKACPRVTELAENRLTVAYDARFLGHDREPTGVPRYACELIRSVASGADVILFVDTSGGGGAEVPGERRVLPGGRGWQQLRLPRALGRLRPSVFHGLQFTVPIMGRVPKIVTVHDLAFRRMPEVVDRETREYLRKWVPWSLRAASRVIVPTEYVRHELLEYVALAPSRVSIIPYGVGSPFTRKQGPAEKSPYPWPYALSVATLEPRKNLPRLVEAFGIAIRRRLSRPHRLVLVGRVGADSDRVHAMISANGLNDRVHLTGYVQQDLLARMYRHADVFLYPSLYEGFGLPLLEAMVSGCPVVTSNSGATAEVVGRFGTLVDPLSVEDLAFAIERALDGTLRDVLVEASAYARDYTWMRAANGTMSVYRSAIAAD